MEYYSHDEVQVVESLIEDSYRFCCRKPDTLMPNSCEVCGSSYAEDNRLVCTEEKCLYEERKAECGCAGERQREEPLPLHLEEVKVRAKRVPKEAEEFWPYMRAKRLVKFLNMKTESKRPSHMQLLEMIANLAKITQEELYKTSPRAYFDKIRYGSIPADAFMRPAKKNG